MSATTPVSFRRYRRRIVALGVAAFLVIFAVGAAITIPRMQNDLEDRVEEQLVANDIVGVTASFSGQDGTLVCAQPLDEADRAVQVGRDVRGVRGIDLDTTCVAAAPGAPESSTSTTASTTSTTDAEESDSSAPTSDAHDLGSIVDVLAEDPLFGQLSDLVEDAGLDTEELLGAPGPITLFAPTDAAFDDAFDTLGADTFGSMTSDPELVRSLLRQHVAEGAVTSDSFGNDSIEMLDGSTLVVDAEIPTFASAGATVGVADPETQLDIGASNGIVHAIDGILLPEDFPLTGDGDSESEEQSAVATTEAVYADGRLVLSGAVVTEEQRAQLRSAAESNVDPSNVEDELVLDEEGPEPAGLDGVAVLVEAVVGNLVSGRVGLVDGALEVEGVPFDDAAAGAVEELADTIGATVALSARPVADATSATELQEELNEFVVANPIEFEIQTIDFTPESIPIVEQVAARAARLQGTDIVVLGFTDTGGSTEGNELFSLGRALAVRDVLIERGLAEDSISATGLGETDPILRPDGTEDPVASRRIEFEVAPR